MPDEMESYLQMRETTFMSFLGHIAFRRLVRM